jgi:hypothetical protein
MERDDFTVAEASPALQFRQRWREMILQWRKGCGSISCFAIQARMEGDDFTVAEGVRKHLRVCEGAAVAVRWAEREA